MPRPTAASSVMPIDWSTRPISSIARHSDVKPPSSPASPAPPNSSGAVRPISPSVAHLLDHVGREVVVAVPLRGVRRDLGLREVADAATELLVLGGQLEGHGRRLARGG